MPESEEKSYYYCRQHENLVMSIKGYVQRYTILGSRGQRTLTCTCRAFYFRKKCKHVDEARKEFCNWHEAIWEGNMTSSFVPGNLISEQISSYDPNWKEKKCCPLCGSELDIDV